MATLRLNEDYIERARAAAGAVAAETQRFIDRHTTVSTERAILRLIGIDGVTEQDVPYANVVIDHLVEHELIGYGAFNLLVDAVVTTGLTPQAAAEQIGRGELDLSALPQADSVLRARKADELVAAAVSRIKKNRETRTERLASYPEEKGALTYVIVATGNIYEDIAQAKAVARQGADIISVIRTTAQSLLDYVPYGATTEGFGGTMATQENFRLMRAALDEVSDELGRYVRLCNFCSGLCMPEIAVMGALERLDVMLNDALYGILFRDINMKRTLIDQYFSRRVNAFAGIMINTGEDNYLTTADAFEEAHTVLASQFLNEQFALLAGVPHELIGLGHAFEMDPARAGTFLLEWAQAQAVRQIFHRSKVKYMPPTKYMTGNIFKGYIQNAMFNSVATLSNQDIHLVGMLTEAIHTPFMSDRALALDNAKYIETTLDGLSDELQFVPGGKAEQRANHVLEAAMNLLLGMQKAGLYNTLAQGTFAGIKRREDGGKGLDGVVTKREGYVNPFDRAFDLKGGQRA